MPQAPELLRDKPQEGLFSVPSEVFVDPEVFDLEVRFIFERTWNFLALESQIPRPNDFVTATIGRSPILITRRPDGGIGAFLNVCRHKGAQVCRSEKGNRKIHVCVYHGWAYDAAGKNVHIKDRDAGCYPGAFDAQGHDLVPLAKLATYRGLIFGSLSSDVPPLEQYLGDFRVVLDLTMDQGPQGMEFVPGRSVYTFGGNWKLQMENGLDTYHLTTTHSSYMNIQQRRHAQKSGNQEGQQFDWKKRFAQEGGMFGFRYGHTATWLNQAQPENRAIYGQIGEVEARVGKTKADWILKLKQGLFFPNMQISDSSATMLRTFRPLAPDLTEMRVYCLAPIGEPDDVRTMRIRQFEDFFSASGFATPDDTIVYEECQRGLAARPVQWLQGYLRGMTSVTQGANAAARELGMNPAYAVVGPYKVQNEIAYHPGLREWGRLIEAGIEGRPAYGPECDAQQ